MWCLIMVEVRLPAAANFLRSNYSNRGAKVEEKAKKWSSEDSVDGPVDSPVDDFEGRSTGSARVLAFLLSGWSVDPTRLIAGEAPVDDHRLAKMKIALGFLGR